MTAWMAAAMAVTPAIGAQAAESDSSETAAQIADAVTETSADKVREILEYMKEKASQGQLETGEDIQKAIAEGEEKYQIQMDEGQKQRLLEGLEELKSMGLSAGQIVEEAASAYEKYGEDAVNHVGEIAAQAVGNTVKTTLTGLIQGILDALKNAFRNFIGDFFAKLG